MMFEISDAVYDNFMGRFSMPLAAHFADFAGVERGRRVVDVGAGTGALTVELVRRGAAVAVAEPSPPFAASLTRRLPEVDVREARAEALPWPDGSFDAALAQLVIAFMSDAPAGVAEMRRVVGAGGTVAVCMWDRDGMEMLSAIHRMQEVVDPGRPTPEQRTTYRTREEIQRLMGDGAEVELLEVEAGYERFDEFWESVLGGAGPSGVWAKALDERRREQARAELFRQVGEPPGPFTLRGAAWAARLTRV
jgi:ubiquinone/menaquinone biosynthesis C-methylase UbiE